MHICDINLEYFDKKSDMIVNDRLRNICFCIFNSPICHLVINSVTCLCYQDLSFNQKLL